MDIDGPESIPEITDAAVPEAGPLPAPGSVGRRVLYRLAVVVLPIAAFVCSVALAPDWQSGDLSAHIGLMLSVNASWPFFPLIAYSVVCLVLVEISPQRYARHFAIRFGIYTGVILTLQYAVLVVPVLVGDSFLWLALAWMAIPFVFPIATRWLKGRWRAARGWLLFGFYLIIYAAAALFIKDPILPLAIFLALTLFAAPYWCLYIMSWTALRLFKDQEVAKSMTLLRGAGAAAWLAAWAGAWAFNVVKMAEMYAALPKYPPDCYIATAAARGHSRFVGSRPVRLAGGGQAWVNRQLQVLKCAELGLAALSPRLHRSVRNVYDVAGRRLAARIRTRILADLAYLSLKPLEWGAQALLGCLIPDFEALAGKMYSSQQGYN